MINIKTHEQLEIMTKGGEILAFTMREIEKVIKEGVSELEIDAMAEKLIREQGGESGFKKVQGYKHTICVSTNEVVVHGIPTGYKFKSGDVVGIDCGVFYKGFHTDMSETFVIGGSASSEVSKFLETGKLALQKGIEQAVLGNHIGNISKTIQDIVEGKGYSIVRSLVGHGVGRDLHEDPEVPGYLNGKVEKTPLLKEGMVIAIEIIYNMGSSELVFANKDGWTLKTEDGSLSGLYERTVAITKNGPKILTK